MKVSVEPVAGERFGELSSVFASWQSNHPSSWKEQTESGVVFAAKNQTGEVVGVAVAGRKTVRQLRNDLFEIRLYVLPTWRKMGVAQELLLKTFEYLDGTDHDRCIGVFCWVTDSEVKAKKNEAIWPVTGMAYLGNSGEGHHLRVRYFKRSVI